MSEPLREACPGEMSVGIDPLTGLIALDLPGCSDFYALDAEQAVQLANTLLRLAGELTKPRVVPS